MSNLIQAFRVYDVFSPKIRMGHSAEGGYIINEILTECTERLVSIGIGAEDSFEVDWFNKYKTVVEAYDGALGCSELCQAHKEYVNERIFYIKHNVGYGENEIPLNVIVDGKSDVLLKIDVVGAEYAMFDHFTPMDNIVGIILDVHDLANRENRNRLCSIIENKFTDFVLFHIHGDSRKPVFDLDISKNNTNSIVVKDFPDTMELSFIHKRVLGNWELDSASYPISELDRSNNPSTKDIDLHWINAI